MILDLLLLFVCAASGVLVWRNIRAYVPRLTALSEEKIAERLHEDSARFLLILMHFRTFWRGRHYRNFFLHLLGKGLLKSHILILRLDNALVRFLQKIRETGAFTSGANGMGGYVRQLRGARHEPSRTDDVASPHRRVPISVPAASRTDRMPSGGEQGEWRMPDAVRVRHRTLHVGSKLEEGLRQQSPHSRPRPSKNRAGEDRSVTETSETMPT